MESFVNYWLTSPFLTHYMNYFPWAWPLAEISHFVGLILLIGGVGIFDLRLLGMAKGLPVAAVRRLLPWGVFGFVLCVASGLCFVLGLNANVPNRVYDVLMTDIWLDLKLLFIFLAGINLLAFYLTGMSRAVDGLGPGDDAPPLAKVIAGTSLFLWLAVIYVGRLIPWGL